MLLEAVGGDGIGSHRLLCSGPAPEWPHELHQHFPRVPGKTIRVISSLWQWNVCVITPNASYLTCSWTCFRTTWVIQDVQLAISPLSPVMIYSLSLSWIIPIRMKTCYNSSLFWKITCQPHTRLTPLSPSLLLSCKTPLKTQPRALPLVSFSAFQNPPLPPPKLFWSRSSGTSLCQGQPCSSFSASSYRPLSLRDLQDSLCDVSFLLLILILRCCHSVPWLYYAYTFSTPYFFLSSLNTVLNFSLDIRLAAQTWHAQNKTCLFPFLMPCLLPSSLLYFLPFFFSFCYYLFPFFNLQWRISNIQKSI